MNITEINSKIICKRNRSVSQINSVVEIATLTRILMTKKWPKYGTSMLFIKKISEKYLILYTCIYSGAVIVYTRDSKYPKM